MKNKEMLKRIAKLESMNDQIVAELHLSSGKLNVHELTSWGNDRRKA